MSIEPASTSKTIAVYITETDGTPQTGLVYNSSGLTCYYARDKAAAVAVTLVTLAAVNSAWASGGFKEIHATNMPGWYRFDVPNAALASGSDYVLFHFKGFSGMSDLPLKIDLVAAASGSGASVDDFMSALGYSTVCVNDGGHNTTQSQIYLTTLPTVTYFKSLLLAIDGVNKGEARPINSYAVDFVTISVPFSGEPADGDKFIILNVR